ncbi:MAG: VCBS repeat-containing protein [Planctomycetaceae bacterium]|nr:VCBS repeat-containing protein [Planctomycetaceae bacterium]
MYPLAFAVIPVLLGEPNFPTRCFSLPGSTERVELVDLDRDGACDVVAVQQAKLRWMQGDGTGAFVARGIVPGSEGWWLRELADIDGDGWVDALGWLQSTGELVQCTGSGSGGFAPPQVVGSGSFLLARCVDVDGDLDLDVVAWQYTTCTLRTFLNTSAGFVPGPVTPTGSLDVHELAVGDFDSDQRADVALSGRTSLGINSGSLCVLHGDGAGNFGPRACLVVGSVPHAIKAVDLDGDGGAELVLAAGSELQAVRHQGQRHYTRSPLLVSSEWAIHAADADADGDADLLISEGSLVRIALNDGTGRFPEGRTLSMHRWDPSTAFGDVDGDGRAEVVGQVQQAAIGVTRSDSGARNELQLLGGSRLTRPRDAGDIDGDGAIDLLLEGDSFLEFHRGCGNGSFAPAVKSEFGWSELRPGATLADFDGDGDLDAIGWDDTGYDVVAVQDGTGRFASPVPLPFSHSSRPLWADFDGDGVLDALRARHDRLVVYRGLGGGEFDSGTTTMTASGSYAWVVADFDGDGRADVVERDPSSTWVRYSLGAGGAFEPADVATCPVHPDRCAARDVNGDGRPDLVWTSLARESIFCLLTDANGRFGSQLRSPTGTDPMAGLDSISLLNVDRDPHPDLVAWMHDSSYGYGPYLLVWPGRGDGRFEGPTLVPTAGSEGLVADLEADGKIEVVLDNYWRSRPVVVRQP